MIRLIGILQLDESEIGSTERPGYGAEFSIDTLSTDDFYPFYDLYSFNIEARTYSDVVGVPRDV
jgi:hypothetical protein